MIDDKPAPPFKNLKQMLCKLSNIIKLIIVLFITVFLLIIIISYVKMQNTINEIKNGDTNKYFIELKEYFQKEFNSELKEQYKISIKNDVLKELKISFKNEIKNEIEKEVEKYVQEDLKDDIKGEIKEQTKSEIKDYITNNLKVEIKNEIKNEMEKEVEKYIQEDLKDDIKGEIKEQTKSEIKDYITNDLKVEIKNEMENEIENDIKNRIVSDVSNQIEGEVKKNIISDVKKEIKNDVVKEAKIEIEGDIKDQIKSEIATYTDNVIKEKSKFFITTEDSINADKLQNKQICNDPNCIVSIQNNGKIFPNIIFTKGMIIAWFGKISEIPEKWAICDGTQGTPDLRNRFIIGSENDLDVGKTGGANETIINKSNLPKIGKGYFSTDSHNGAYHHNSNGFIKEVGRYSASVKIGEPDDWGSNLLIDLENGMNSSPIDIMNPYYYLFFIMKL